MSRRRRIKRREIIPDSRYKHGVISKFINCLMYEGKKAVAETIVYEAISITAEKLAVDAVEAFEGVMSNIRPMIEVRSRRVGGATYQVPMEVRAERGITLAIRWLIKSSRARKGKTMIEKLSGEMIDAYNKRGTAVKKREDTHKMAEANRAFAHYRW